MADECSGQRKARVILVNDDGIDAPGLQCLRHALADLCDLLVVAPKNEQSGAGCSLHLVGETVVEKRRDADGHVWGYAVDGTPVECIKFAIAGLGEKPDLVLSGINRGRNVGNSIFYSGTVAGATEATFFGIRAMAISLDAFREADYHFETAARITCDLLPWLLDQPWRPRTLWNLNVPNIPPNGKAPALKLSHMGTAFFADEYELLSEDADRAVYRNNGSHVEHTPEPADSDDLMLRRGHASLGLLSLDMTASFGTEDREALERQWQKAGAHSK